MSRNLSVKPLLLLLRAFLYKKGAFVKESQQKAFVVVAEGPPLLKGACVKESLCEAFVVVAEGLPL